jgi:hypothetical protein
MNPSMLGAGATSGLAVRPCAVGAHSSRAGGFGSRVWILDSRRLGDGGSSRLRNRGSLAWSRGGCDYRCGGGRCRRRRRQTRIWTVRGRRVTAGAQQQKGWYQRQKRPLNHVAHRLNRARASGTLVDKSARCNSPQASPPPLLASCARFGLKPSGWPTAAIGQWCSGLGHGPLKK